VLDTFNSATSSLFYLNSSNRMSHCTLILFLLHPFNVGLPFFSQIFSVIRESLKFLIRGGCLMKDRLWTDLWMSDRVLALLSSIQIESLLVSC